MKGLLIKDFKLMKNQKNFFLVIVVIAVGMSLLWQTSFVVGYVSFVGSLFTLSSISYDEFDDGNAFLFSLPISRKGYTVEKYEFGLLVSGASWLFSVVVVILAEGLRHSVSVKEILLEASTLIPVLLILLAVMLPVQFKFGGEKGRIAIVGIFAVLFAIGFAAVKLAELFHIDLIAVLNSLSEKSVGMIILAASGIGVLLLLISMKISVAIMNRKEF